jgi:PadR family transcriptional regulator PadR
MRARLLPSGAHRKTTAAHASIALQAGRKQLQAETRAWEQTAAIIARFFEVKAEDLR